MKTARFPLSIACAVLGLLHGPVSAQSTNTRQALDDAQSVGRTDLLCERLFQPSSPLDASMALGSAAAESLLTRAMGALQSGRPTSLGQNPTGMRKEDLQRFATRSVWLPIAFEEMLGQRMASDLNLSSADDLKSRRNARRYLEVQQTFDRLIASLPADQPYRLRLMFSDEPGDNASALPGGLVIVQQGLVSRNPAVVAGVLAHEISHVLQRHQTRHYQSLLADSFDATELARMTAGGRSDWDKAIDKLTRADQIGRRFASYHSGQELEADACMARMLSQAGFPAASVSTEFSNWIGSKGDTAGKQADPYALRHPSSDERAQALKRSVQHWASRSPVADTPSGSPGTPAPLASPGASSQAPAAAEPSSQRESPTGAQDSFNRLTGSVRSFVKDLGEQIKSGSAPQDGQSEPLN